MRQQMKKEERHMHILRTAKKLFQDHGYDNVTIADVVKSSNVARGTFYLHFESLEQLLTDLFEEAVNDLWEHIEPILNNLEIPFKICTVEVIEAVFRMFDDERSMIDAFYSGGGQAFLDAKHKAFERLGEFMVKALEYRHQTTIPNAKWTVAMLISLVGEMSYYAHIHVPIEERGAFEQQLIRFVLAGLREHLTPYVQLDSI